MTRSQGSVIVVEMVDELLNQVAGSIAIGQHEEAKTRLTKIRSILNRHVERMDKMLELRQHSINIALKYGHVHDH